jgi:hypothetical protein
VEFSFHPGRDEKEAQTVEITFSSVPDGARVVLSHSGWQKLTASDNPTGTRDFQPVWMSALPCYHQPTIVSNANEDAGRLIVKHPLR